MAIQSGGMSNGGGLGQLMQLYNLYGSLAGSGLGSDLGLTPDAGTGGALGRRIDAINGQGSIIPGKKDSNSGSALSALGPLLMTALA